MAKIYYQEDCNLSLLEGKTIAVIGYGSQGHAHALNAKESGCHVIIGLYEGSRSWKRAEEEINTYCMKLPKYKRPRKVIFADIPRNPTGKIEKPKLRKIYGGESLVAAQNKS